MYAIYAIKLAYVTVYLQPSTQFGIRARVCSKHGLWRGDVGSEPRIEQEPDKGRPAKGPVLYVKVHLS